MNVKSVALAVVFIFGICLNLFVHSAETARAAPAEDVTEVMVEGKAIELESPDQVRTDERKPMLRARAVDYLEALPGVDLYRQSYGGARNNMLRLRGLDESRLVIMADDAPLDGSGVYGAYYVDWESLTLDDIETIEVIRGGHSARYGNTLGGVVIIKRKKPTGKLENLARASISSFNTENYQFRHSWGIGPVYWTAAGSSYETDGYLRNNYNLRGNYKLDLAFKLTPRTWLCLYGKSTDTETGFIVKNDDPDDFYYNAAYPESLEDPLAGPYVPFVGGDLYWGDDSHWRDQRHFYSLDFEHKFNSLKLKFNFVWNQQERWEYFYAIDDSDHLVYKRYSRPEDNTWSTWIGAEEHKIGDHSLDYGFEVRNYGYGKTKNKKVDSDYFMFDPTESPSRFNAQRLYSVYIQDKWRMLKWLRFEPGLRYDNYSSDNDVDNLHLDRWSPKMSLIFLPWEGGKIAVRTSKAYRFPTCPESYWFFNGYDPADDGIYRKNLRPEDAMLYDLELSQTFSDSVKTVKIDLRGYYYQIDDYIRTIFEYRPSRVVYNIDRVDLGGVELSSSVLLKRGFSIFAAYTYQDTGKKGDILDLSTELTKRLPELPRNKASLALGYYGKNDAIIRLRAKWIDQRKQIVGNQAQPDATSLEKLDSAVLVSIDASYPIFRKGSEFQGTVIAGIENLTDEDYQEIWGYPMPGRTFSVGFELKF